MNQNEPHLSWEEYALKSADWHESQRERWFQVGVHARNSGRKSLGLSAGSNAAYHARIHEGVKYVYVAMVEARNQRDELYAEVVSLRETVKKQDMQIRFGRTTGNLLYRAIKLIRNKLARFMEETRPRTAIYAKDRHTAQTRNA